MEFLKINNLSRVYKQSEEVETVALQPTDLTFRKGDFSVISGPSGSGKTTLLNLIGGLDAPTTGTVELEGTQLTGLSEKELAHQRLTKIGFIFQAYNLVPVLTAHENIEYIMALQGVPVEERKRRVMAIATELGIEHLLQKRPGEMSGGQQQRVAVARAVVAQPRLILADEPTANLDSKTGENLMQLMKGLNQNKDITIIFSSHDPLVISKALYHIELKDGRVVANQRK